MINFRKERLDRGLSLTQMSELMGVPRNTIARIERGAEPVPETKRKFAEFYGCAVTDIWPVEDSERTTA